MKNKFTVVQNNEIINYNLIDKDSSSNL